MNLNWDLNFCRKKKSLLNNVLIKNSSAVNCVHGALKIAADDGKFKLLKAEYQIHFGHINVKLVSVSNTPLK